MSLPPISRSRDLQRLRDEGYDVAIVAEHVLLRDVPYVNDRRELKRGTLVSELTTAGDVTSTPKTHVMHFVGEYPCDKNGRAIENIRHASNRQELAPGIVVDHSLSSKPEGGYKDYYEKMSTYATIISSPAASLDPYATPKTFPAIVPEPDESVFQYLDTASSRAGITGVASKFAGEHVAILGVGGTGSYLLDLVAKTPVAEIHLFDGDGFLTHNAFRAPGAARLEDLRRAPNKAAYFAAEYSRLHRHIIPHELFIDENNVELLRRMTFVFLSMDQGTSKKAIIGRLEEWGIPFIDVGMGVTLIDGELHGVLRVTTSTPKARVHVHEKRRIPFTDGDAQDEYDENIQLADLNALNAVLAVIKWKKLRRFYRDLENEHYSTYTTDGNALTNEDQG